MHYRVNHTMIELTQGNIAREELDAIVNTAGSTLSEGHEVFGAIHHQAGPELLAACRRLGFCDEGEARITAGYRLKTRYVIHVATPRSRRHRHRLAWDDDDDREAILAREAIEEPLTLAAAYRNCLQLAVEYRLTSLAFPSLGTGDYGFSVAQAAPIALQTVKAFLEEDRAHGLELVRFVFWNELVYQTFVRCAAEVLPVCDG